LKRDVYESLSSDVDKGVGSPGMIKELESRNKVLAPILTSTEFQKAEDGMKQMLAEVRDEAQVEVVKQNQEITKEYNNQTQVFEKTTGVSFDDRDKYIESYNKEQLAIDDQLKQITGGVGFDDLRNYKPKSQEELNAINDLVSQSQQLYNEKMAPINQVFNNLQALSAKSERVNTLANNALLLMNYQDIARFKGDYNDNAFKGLYNETMKGLAQGNVNRAFLNVAFGITDINDPEQLAKVSQRVALQNAYTQGKLSTRVFERYLNAGSVAEQMSLIGQNPIEILASLWASSMSQFASTGIVTLAPIVGGSTLAGAGVGATGFVSGPGGVVTTAGGAAAGFGKGMMAWSTITGFSMELGAAYSTVLARKGVDMTDADAIAREMRNEDTMKEAFDIGLKRGIPIAVMNLAGGMASKAFVAPLASPTKQMALALTAKTVVDPLFEGLGEGMAQVISGEGLQMTEVFNEMIGGQFGNQSSMAVKVFSNTVLTNQSGKLSEEDGETIIQNAIINDAVNNLIDNKKKTVSERVKKVLGVSNSPQRKRLAHLIEEKQTFSKNKQLVSDIDAEIESILETGVVPQDKIELVSDYQEVVAKEMRGVNSALKALGIDQGLGVINIDNIEEVENNPEAKAIIQKMMDQENKNMETPYASISEYLVDVMEGSTHAITPKELGKQFTLFSGKSMMADMIANRGEKNRASTKGFRHEALHFILDNALSEAEIEGIATDLESYMEVESAKDGGAISSGAYARVKNRLDGYKKLLESGEYTQAMYNQEVFTTLSDAINDKDLIYERQNKNFWQKIADDLVDFFKYRVKKGKYQETINADLISTPEGAFEFLKNYNKAFLGQNKRRYKKVKATTPTGGKVIPDSKESKLTKFSKKLSSEKTTAVEQSILDLKQEIKENEDIAKKFGKEPIPTAKQQRLEQSILKDQLKPTIDSFVESQTKRLFDPIAPDARNNVTRQAFRESMVSDIETMIVKEFEQKQDIEKFITSRGYLRANSLAKRLGIKSVEQGITKDIDQAKGVAAETETVTVEEKTPTKQIKLKERLGDDAVKITEEVKKRGKDIDLETVDFKTLKDLTPEMTQEMFGISPKPGNLSKADVRNAQQFISKNADVLIAMLPEGSTPSGTSTGVQKVLLDAFYTKGDRAVMSKTGSKAGLKEQTKRDNITKEEFNELFGITPAGQPNLSDRNTSSRIKALVTQTGRMLTNQAIREQAEAKGEKVPSKVFEGKSKLMFSKADKYQAMQVQNVGSSFNNLSTENKIEFNSKLDDFINALSVGYSVDAAFQDAYGDFLNKKDGTPNNQRIKIIQGWKKVNDFIFDQQRKLNDGKPNIDKVQEYLYQSFSEQTEREVYQEILGLKKRSIDFSNKEQIISYVSALKEFIGKKREDGRLRTDRDLVDYAENVLGPLLTSSSKVGDGSLKWSFENGVWELVDSGKKGSTRYSIFKNKGEMMDVLINEFLTDKESYEWKMSESTSKDGVITKSGKLLYKGESLLNNEFKGFRSQTPNLYLKDYTDNGKISNRTLSKSETFAKFNRNTVLEILEFLKEKANDPESQITKNDLGMFFMESNGDMKAPLRASANVDGIAVDKSLKPGNYRYEHNPPARTMLVHMANYVNGKIDLEQLNKEFDNFSVTIIPLSMDEVINLKYKDTIPIGGETRKYRRYYNTFTFGAFPFSTIEYVKQDNGTYKQVVHGAYQAEAYKKVQPAKKKNITGLKKSKVVKTSDQAPNSEDIRQAEVLDKALNIARDPNAPVKKIRVFDFDDTLARTKSNVLYTMPDGTKGKLTAEEFAKKGDKMLAEGAVWDFSEFNKVMEGREGPLLGVAKLIQQARGTKDVFVLTARAAAAAPAIKEFLDSVGLDIPIENITGLGDSSPLAKSNWVVDKAADGYNDFYFADDHLGNVDAVKKVLDVIDVKSKVQQAKVKFSKTVDQMMNNIIYEKTGIEQYKEFSEIAAQARGRKKKSWNLIPPSAQDFGGLLYKLLAKGKQGDTQWEWMQEHLIKPYGRAMNDLSVAQNQLMADFRALKESLSGIPKNLKKEAFGGFTNEDVVRVATWDRQGIEVDGISKRDLEAVRKYVANKPDLNIFIDQLVAITKGDGYYYPGKNWLAGTITTDFREGLRKVTRKNLLEQWQANVDLAFNENTMNKLEAAFGPKYREALENSLERMSSGQNRRQGMSRIEQRFLDYINNSVGAVMFLNARSAVLQTISAVNFINWKDNNPMKAALAFANQKQYWSDFMKLMNSDFLVDRRNGLKINVSESEIAEAAKTSKNTVKGVITYLLNKGFAFTQIADSFAIATGGATLYRNRIKTYKKQGLSEAEATEKAFLDFRELAEESQQSARADKISQQQASTLGRLVLAFANTPSQYARIMDKAGRDLINNRGDWKANISKIAYYGFVQNLLFTTLQSALFAYGMDDDEEEDMKVFPKDKMLDAANSMADIIFRGMGVAGVVLAQSKNTIIDLI
jgi:hypothetical protein